MQIFDSWAGALGRADYREFALPHTKRIFDGLADAGVPLIHFGVGATAILPRSRRSRRRRHRRRLAPGLDEAWKTIGASRGIQGNLDPALLFGPRDRLLAAADDMLRARRRPAGAHLQSGPRRAAARRPSRTCRRWPTTCTPEREHDLEQSSARSQFDFSIQHSAFGIAFMVIIVGGGIIGLAAAFELATRRVPFLLLEASDRTGGLVRTERVERLHHRRWRRLDARRTSLRRCDLCEELGLGHALDDDRLRRARRTCMRAADCTRCRRRRCFGIPTTPSGIAGYELLPICCPGAPRARAGSISIRARPPADATPRDNESKTSRSRISIAGEFGPETVGLIAQPLLGGIHAGDVERLSVGAVAPGSSSAARSGSCSLRRRRAPSRATVARDLQSAVAAAWASSSRRSNAGCLPEAFDSNTRAKSVSLTRPGRWRVVTERRQAIDAARGYHRDTRARRRARCSSELTPVLARLCAEIPLRLHRQRRARLAARDASPIRSHGSGFVVAHSKSVCVSARAHGSRPSGRIAHPPDTALLRAFLGGAH